jgi:hypothetical protein
MSNNRFQPSNALDCIYCSNKEERSIREDLLCFVRSILPFCQTVVSLFLRGEELSSGVTGHWVRCWMEIEVLEISCCNIYC